MEVASNLILSRIVCGLSKVDPDELIAALAAFRSTSAAVMRCQRAELQSGSGLNSPEMRDVTKRHRKSETALVSATVRAFRSLEKGMF